METDDLLAALRSVRDEAVELERRLAPRIDRVPASQRQSARNLVHYLAMRRLDLRDAQRELAHRGLSSLGRSEAHVLATVDAVMRHLDPSHTSDEPPAGVGDLMLATHAADALGPLTGGDRVRLMVTMPSEAATDPSVAQRFVDAGLDVARVNAAHDGPEAWHAMVRNVREAAERAGREVRVAFDLAGPKLRTGPVAPGPRVRKIRPDRSADGTVVGPARVWFAADGARGDAVPIDPELVAAAAVGDELQLRDARGRKRALVIDQVDGNRLHATCERTVYLATMTAVGLHRAGKRVATGRIGDLPPVPGFVMVQRGDELEVALAVDPDEQSRHGRIVVDVPELFTAVHPGERVLVDDGAIELAVLEVRPDSIRTEVLRPERGKVRAEKGINLPDTTLSIPALGPDDRAALQEMAGEVDLFALSFVSRPADLDDLWAELDRCGAGDTGVILKIEHSTAFRNLPDLLLHGLQRPPIAVMVARGDLAVEVGFERLAEVQEQILWVCEAAHVPVIWATQVLESLAKDGVPSRAEVTDAAWGSRAECVMLNKGPHITEAMRFLDDVFERMHAHQDKRTAMFRPLSIAATFGEG